MDVNRKTNSAPTSLSTIVASTGIALADAVRTDEKRKADAGERGLGVRITCSIHILKDWSSNSRKFVCGVGRSGGSPALKSIRYSTYIHYYGLLYENKGLRRRESH